MKFFLTSVIFNLLTFTKVFKVQFFLKRRERKIEGEREGKTRAVRQTFQSVSISFGIEA